MKESLIVAKGLTKEYVVGPQRVIALDDVNVEIESGELLAIMGPSGSGKSTFLNMIGGLDTPTSGDVFVDGKSLKGLDDNELSTYRNQTIGFVFQFFYLQQYLNVKQNIGVPLMFSRTDKHKREQLVEKVINDVGLQDRSNHLPSQLSGGQMQRVAIARALVNQPKMILADEPTGNLDKKTGEEIMELLKELNKKLTATILIVTHNQEIADQCNRVINFSDGRVQ